MPNSSRSDRGFAALMGVIIMAALLLALTVALNASQFFRRSNVTDVEAKTQSRLLAEACLDTALIYLNRNPDYAPAPGGDVIPVVADSCVIVSVSGTLQKIIRVRAVHRFAATNLQAAAALSGGVFSVTSLQELANF